MNSEILEKRQKIIAWCLRDYIKNGDVDPESMKELNKIIGVVE